MENNLNKAKIYHFNKILKSKIYDDYYFNFKDPFKLNLNIKTIDSKLKNQNAIIEIERLNTQISLKSLVEKKFLIENLEISLKSLKVKNLISFIRSFQNTPQLFILKKMVNFYLGYSHQILLFKTIAHQQLKRLLLIYQF